MNTLLTTTLDGTQIAYDHIGAGPALILLHGGGSSRQDWHDEGYVKRLQENFTVITLDLRGHGESGLPTEPADYAIDKMLQDILAVADACMVESFTIWGFSFGGRIGRYLAAQSGRVDKIILMCTPLGQGVSGELRQDIEAFCAHWSPILQARRDETLDIYSLSQDDRELLGDKNLPVRLAWGQAMLDWPTIVPADFRCPVLWIVGSEDRLAMESYREFEQSLEGSRVRGHIVEGLDHVQVFEKIDMVFDTMLDFTRSR